MTNTNPSSGDVPLPVPVSAQPLSGAGTGDAPFGHDILTKRPISHDEAREAMQRLVNSHFHQEPHGRFGIPARPDYDDDLVLAAYIEQQRKKDGERRS